MASFSAASEIGLTLELPHSSQYRAWVGHRSSFWTVTLVSR